MAAKNLLKARIASGEVTIGLSCSSGSAHAVELFAHGELDYIYLDQQHGLTSLDTLLAQLRAFSGTTTTPLVRVLRNDPGLIGQALDAGAHGVIVPMINTIEDARAAASACRYQPAGVRSWGPLRAAFGLGSDPDEVNREVLCLVMVETIAGIENVERIANEPGVDGVYIGPADLAVSMGLKPGLDRQAGAHSDAIRRIVAACRAAGKTAAMSGDPHALSDLGFAMITVGSDVGYLGAGLARAVELRRAVTGSGVV